MGSSKLHCFAIKLPLLWLPACKQGLSCWPPNSNLIAQQHSCCDYAGIQSTAMAGTAKHPRELLHSMFDLCTIVAHAGVADALEKKYLESLQFGISRDPEGSQLLEASLLGHL